MADRAERKNQNDGGTRARDLMVSLGLLALLLAFVLAGLAWEENWQKLLRVLIGFVAYVLVLLSAFGLYRLIMKRGAGLPFAAFALAGAAAEISSGWLRPTAKTALDLSTALAAAILIGGLHWLALRLRRPLRERITKSNESTGDGGKTTTF